MRLLAALILAAGLFLAAPADADTATTTDPPGDGLKGRALDITSIRVSNRDHALVVRVSFVRAAHGDLGVYYWARGDRRRDGAGVFARHRGGGDTTELGSREGEQPCRGLTVRWDHEADTATVRLPSRCFRDGDYGAVRVKVITEIGSDADISPKGPGGGWAWTRWVARG